MSSPVSYDFEQLAEQLLPFTRSELQLLRTDRAVQKAARETRLKLAADNPKADKFKGYNGRSLAWARLEDLRTLGQLRGGWSVGENSMRTTALHWQMNFLCLSGAVHPAIFHHEAHELSKQLDPSWKFAADELGTLRPMRKDSPSSSAVANGRRFTRRRTKR